MNEIISKEALETYDKLTKFAKSTADEWVKGYTGSSSGVYSTNVSIDITQNLILFDYRYVDGFALAYPVKSLDLKFLGDLTGAKQEGARLRNEENKASIVESDKIRELENTEVWREWNKLKNKNHYIGYSNFQVSI